MDARTETLAALLDATLDATKHKKAERELKLEEKKPQFSIRLLQIVANNAMPLKTRLAGALCFKNFIRHNYVDEDGNYKLPLDEVGLIKTELIDLMIRSPPSIQTQLGEAISIIADSDFWERWDTLIQDLCNKLTPDNYQINNGVLEVAHSIFARWRPLFRSDALYTEINHVVSTFGHPFLQLLTVTDSQIEANKADKAKLKGYFETMSLLLRIFYDLSCHDLPPPFEESLGSIAGLLHKYLEYNNPLLDTDDDTEAGILETVKSEVCEAVQLYTTKYDEDFGQYCAPFIQSAWSLLSTIGPQPKFDILVSKALQFLTAVASIDRHAQNFNNEAVLKEIVEKVILPNVALRESDMELFEDEPIEFIRRDLEGADTDSRRKAATDLLRQLLEKFDALVSQVVFSYISEYLQRGQTDWKAKDTAIYLFLSIAAKGAVTAAHGVKTVNPYVDVVSFFKDNIANDLVGGEGVAPIAKVDAIKYLYTFRSQLTKEQWQAAFPPLIQNMASSNYVVYTYAAIAVERVLYLTDESGQHVFSRQDIEPLSKDLLDHLFKLIESEKAPPKMQENEFLMRCIMRVLVVIKDGVLPILEETLDHLIQITNVIKTNPSNPRFYYYHFEAIGAIVRYCAPTAGGQKLEERLWEPLNFILTEEVNEFMPYVYQLLAALLESNRTGMLPAKYTGLIVLLLNPASWESRGNIPGCARLLSAVIPRAALLIESEGKIEQVLGIFQGLMNSKKTDQYGFDVLESVTVSYKGPVLEPYFPTILQILFQKLEKTPSDSFKQRLVRFYHLVSAKLEDGYGADYFIRHAMSLQENVFVPLYLQIILPTTEQFARPIDRKLAVISLTMTLCHSAAFAERYAKGWRFTCEHMLKLLRNPPKVAVGVGDEVITEADVDDIGFGLGFTPLNTCKQTPRDDFPNITSIQAWVGEHMRAADASKNGMISKFAAERLSEEGKSALAQYFA